MKIKKFEIENYRNLKKVSIEFNDLTIFIGENDAGKSNILKALDLFFNWDESRDIKEISQGKSVSSDQLTMNIELKNQRIFNNDGQTITLKGYIQLSPSELKNIFPTEEIAFESSKDNVIRYPISDTIIITVRIILKDNKNASFEVTSIDMKDLPIHIYHRNNNQFLLRGNEDSSYRYGGAGTNIYYFLIMLVRKNFLLIPAIRKVEKELMTEATARSMESNGSYMANEFLRCEKEISTNGEEIFEQINNQVSQIFPSYKKVVSKTENNQKLVDIFFNKFPSSSVGTGINQLFVSIFDLNFYKNVIFGMEEPEVHLHPKAQRDVFNFLRKQSNTKQIILTTHSSIFVNCFDNLKLYLVKKSSDTIANVLNIENKEKFKLIKYELGIKNSDLFFNDFIIFIEGETEEKAIPILFSAVGMTLEESGIYQINIRGVGRLAKIKEFLIYIKNFDMKSFLILDDDDGVKEKIKDLQREGLVTDNFYIWKKGTFLDCFDEHYVIRAMNNLYPNKFDMTEKQLKDEKDKGKSTEKFLTKYLHERELGDLNKPALGEEIALIVKEEINSGKERKETEAEEILKNIFSQFSSNK